MNAEAPEKKDREGRFRRKKNPLADAKITEVSFKDVTLLKYFVSERGRILPRRLTGVTAKQQRMLARAIKQARVLALLPTVGLEQPVQGGPRPEPAGARFAARGES